MGYVGEDYDRKNGRNVSKLSENEDTGREVRDKHEDRKRYNKDESRSGTGKIMRELARESWYLRTRIGN